MAGIPCAACVELNNSLVLDFNVIIVSENDLPVITGPAYQTVMQDQDLTFQNLIVSDPDAEDITMGRSGPVSGAQMLVKVSCDWCTLRVPSVLFDDGKFQVAPNFMEPGCLAVCKGSQLPVATMDEHLLLPKACRTCVVEHGWAAMREGRGELIFFSNLLQAKAFLADIVYRGVYGYNSKWVKESIPRIVACEETPRIKPEPQEDQVVLEISDLSNNGCTKRTWNQPPSIFKSWVRVSDVEDAPQLVLFKSGKDVCLGCQSNDFKCCTARNVIVTTEEFPVVFGPPPSTYAIMFDSPEFLNFEFPSYIFRTTVKVSRGTLRFPKYDDPKVALFYPADFLWLSPTDPAEIAGKQCTWDLAAGGTPSDCAAKGYRGFTVSSRMCTLNELIDLMVYTPDIDFNTLLGEPDFINVTIDSEPPSLTTAPGKISIAVFVEAVNDVPLVRLNTRAVSGLPTPDLFGELPVEDVFIDFHEGGLQTSKCRAGLNCFSIFDADVCENKFSATNSTPGFSRLNEIKELTLDKCADPSTSAGNLLFLVRVRQGSVWFFSRLEWELSDASPCKAKARGCSSDEEWTRYVEVVSPPASAGKDSRKINLVKPLPYFKGGLLRYFSSSSSSLPDNISVFVDDLQNTGAANPKFNGTCCCVDAACKQCVFTAEDFITNDCVIRLNVSACGRVPGWVCGDKSDIKRSPGWQTTVIMVASIVGAMISVFALKFLGSEHSEGIYKPVVQGLNVDDGHLGDSEIEELAT
jgi:hypothetical protein